MFSERSEDILMARYAEGDDRALDVLFDRLAPRVLSFLRCSQREPERAEQLLQSTFVQLHRLRRAYPRGTSARAWVLGIAANVQLQPTRRLRWLPLLGAQRSRAVSGHAASQNTSESRRERAVREAIAGLQEADRQLLHLHRVEGMSFGEIAQVVGVSEAVIRVRAIGSYRQLRERLLELVSDGGES
jgi:RNA polymerase sigma-70 factor (ECF subfamily)